MVFITFLMYNFLTEDFYKRGIFMNYLYLIRHISYHLHTFVRRYDSRFALTDSFCGRIAFTDEPAYEPVTGFLQTVIPLDGTPLLLSVNGQLVYSFIPTGDAFFLIGPVRLSTPVSLHLTVEVPAFSPQWLDSVPVCEFPDLSSNTLLVCNLHRKDILDENTLLLSNCIRTGTEDEVQKFFSDLIFENREYGKRHNPYDQEVRETSSIENGDVEQLKRSIAEDYQGEIGTLAKNPLRNAKNLGIVNITLASRAAMRGGLLPELAYSLSDSYIQKIEDTNDIPTIHHIFRSAEYHYAQLVRETLDAKAGIPHKEKNPHINRCKDYIFSHLHGRISVQEIADELAISPNYLSELFHQCEGVSIVTFIQDEKIKLVKNLLIYSHYSYSEIASYLGYCSQSHLGKQFKKSTGYTLSQYRRKYSMEGF